MRTFKFDVATTNGETVVRLDGELDIAELDRFSVAVGRLILDGHRRVVLDCAHLTFVDAVGLGAIMRLVKLADCHAAQVVLRNLEGEPLLALSATNLTDMLSDRGTAA